MNRLPLGRGLAAACMVTGLALTWHSFRLADAAAPRLRKKVADFRQLQQLEVREQRLRAARQKYESLENPKAQSLAEVVAGALPGQEAETRQKESAAPLEGWVRLTADVSFPEIRLADAGRFLVYAGQQRPPWRLSECSVVCADQNPGAGRVALALETFSRVK